jgi:hypothetical protein
VTTALAGVIERIQRLWERDDDRFDRHVRSLIGRRNRRHMGRCASRGRSEGLLAEPAIAPCAVPMSFRSVSSASSDTAPIDAAATCWPVLRDSETTAMCRRNEGAGKWIAIHGMHHAGGNRPATKGAEEISPGRARANAFWIWPSGRRFDPVPAN